MHSAAESSPTAAQRLIPGLTAGFVVGLLEVATTISFVALIFGADLTDFLPNAIGYALLGTVIGSAVIALFTSLPGIVGGTQDVPAVIIALMAVNIAAGMPASSDPEVLFYTVVAVIALTAVVSGLFLWLMGRLQLGDLARFLPYPVVGGFLAGTGWLLIAGAVGLMADLPAAFSSLVALVQPDVLVRWLPGLLLALLMISIVKRFDHYLILPALLLISILFFFLTARFFGYSVAELSAAGWLLGPFENEKLWQPPTVANLTAVYWPAIVQQAISIAAVVFIGTFSLLLNSSGIELALHREVDFDKELRVAGLANLLAGLTAGLVNYQALSSTTLNFRLGADRRLSGLVMAGICAVVLLAGGAWLALFPKMIIGALLLLLGLSFVDEWVIQGWSNMPRIDFAIVLVILLATIFIGFLEAVALGLLLAVLLFVVGYSEVDVVRHELSGATYRSRVVRSWQEAELLQHYGAATLLLQLQGFLFFGTADSLYNELRNRLSDDDLPPLTAVVLDMENITGIDSTAIISFNKMMKLAAARNFALVLCGPHAQVRRQLEKGGLDTEAPPVAYFNSADEGMAWCEQRLLARHEVEIARLRDLPQHLTLLEQTTLALLAADRSADEPGYTVETAALSAMAGYVERLDLDTGTIFITQGEPADSLYFLAAGRVTARLKQPDGSSFRLESMGPANIVGELGFFLRTRRSADVVTDEPSTLFKLTRRALRDMEANDPQAAVLLHSLTAHVLAVRVTHLTDTVKALER